MLRRMIVTLLVCTPLMAQEEGAKLLRVYQLGGLIPRVQQNSEDFTETLYQRAPFTPVGPMVVGEFPDPESFWLQEETSDARDVAGSVEEILESITQGIDIEKASGGESLLVRATLSQHKRIAQVMEALFRGGGEPFRIGVQHLSLPASAVDEGVEKLLDAAVAGKLDDDGRKRLIALDLHRGERSGVLHATPGRWTVLRAVREVRYVPDYDVEIAQAAAIADPITSTASEGLKAAVRAFRLQDGRVLVRAVISAGDLDPDFRRFDMQRHERDKTLRLRDTDYGLVEQSDYRGCALSTETVLRAGRSGGLVAGIEDARVHVILFTLRETPKPARAGDWLVLGIGSLSAPDRTRRVEFRARNEIFLVPSDRSARFDLEDLTGKLRGSLPQGFIHAATWLNGGSLVLGTKAGGAEVVRRAMENLEQALLKPLRLRVRLMSGTRLVGLLNAPVVVGRPAAFAAYHRLDYIQDYEVEVAQEARIAGPDPAAAFGGIFANVRISKAGAGVYRLRLELKLLGMTEGIHTFFPETGGLPLIQSVPVRTNETVSRLDVRPGAAQTLELGPNPFARGRDGRGKLRAIVTIEER